MANQSEGFARFFVAASPGSAEHITDTKAKSWSFTTGAQQYQQVLVSGGAYTSLTVPSGALAVAVILPSSGAHEITLKGASGDTGITMSGDRGVPYMQEIRQGATIGFQNTSANTTIEVYWF